LLKTVIISECQIWGFSQNFLCSLWLKEAGAIQVSKIVSDYIQKLHNVCKKRWCLLWKKWRLLNGMHGFSDKVSKFMTGKGSMRKSNVYSLPFTENDTIYPWLKTFTIWITRYRMGLIPILCTSFNAGVNVWKRGFYGFSVSCALAQAKNAWLYHSCNNCFQTGWTEIWHVYAWALGQVFKKSQYPVFCSFIKEEKANGLQWKRQVMRSGSRLSSLIAALTSLVNILHHRQR
jgi:hypothetical protein